MKAPWEGFLENCRLRLPPSHPLNNLTLAVRLDLAIGRDGTLQGARIVDQSGHEPFDSTAVEVALGASPFPEPPGDLISDDETVHILWLFARDRRQAGAATAELRRVEWEAARSVPKFLTAGDLATAAQRLAREAIAKRKSNPDLYLKLGREIAVAAIRDALRHKDVNVQRIGVRAAVSANILAAAPELRQIINTAVDVSLRGEAIAAVGTIGDQGAGPLLIEVMETAKGSGVGGNADNSAAAARALAAIGKGDVAQATIQNWLEAPDKESQWAALVVMAEFAVPTAVPILARTAGDASAPRPIRLAACRALGTSTTRAVAQQGMAAIRKGFGNRDAGIRAACVQSAARAARAGIRSRLTYWAVIELMKKDRDERVRAAAVLAATHLDPARFQSELYVLRREKSPVVLAALARGLAVVPAAAAVKKLIQLTKSEHPTVRRTAARSLGQRNEAWGHKALAKLIDDSDPEVRLAAVAALDNLAVLSQLLGDPSPAVRSAAFGSTVRLRGQLETLPRFAQAMVEASSENAERVLWAMSWLNKAGAGQGPGQE